MKKLFFLLMVAAGCGPKPNDSLPVGYKVHELLIQPDNGLIRFALPGSFIKLDSIKLHPTDTLSFLYALKTRQESDAALNFYYDKANDSTYIAVSVGPRVIISNEEAKRTYFTVPTIPLRNIFPVENEHLKIISDQRNQKHGDKTWFKRKVRVTEGSLTYLVIYYFISDNYHSSVFVVTCKDDPILDKNFLDLKVVPARKLF